MLRTLALVLAATSVALGLSVASADTADARRNVGGTMPAGAVCVTPGQAQVRSDRAKDVLDCFCWYVPAPDERNVGGTVPIVDTNCPPGILKQVLRP